MVSKTENINFKERCYLYKYSPNVLTDVKTIDIIIKYFNSTSAKTFTHYFILSWLYKYNNFFHGFYKFPFLNTDSWKAHKTLISIPKMIPIFLQYLIKDSCSSCNSENNSFLTFSKSIRWFFLSFICQI